MADFSRTGGGTGGTGRSYKDVKCAFGRYVITVRLTDSDEFVGIVEVAVSRDFRSQGQRIASETYEDVADLYEP